VHCHRNPEGEVFGHPSAGLCAAEGGDLNATASPVAARNKFVLASKLLQQIRMLFLKRCDVCE
jgi:hypothetical protein